MACVIVIAFEKRDPSRGTCWDYVQDRSFELSNSIDFEEHIGIDSLRSSKLLNNWYMDEIDEMRASWTVDNTRWLLTKLLPWTGNPGFIVFCCLLRGKHKLPRVGWEVCDACEEFDFQKCNISKSEGLSLTNCASQ